MGVTGPDPETLYFTGRKKPDLEDLRSAVDDKSEDQGLDRALKLAGLGV
ncbi:hypothetical protein XCCB100_3115 [Xanthomonas campestris pv. campestris]|uniref:Uncharacterized protein n=1 Tax=Xanthomonas campestris pv. campestris (strain B100) TaxID=509169 RepID=B0RXB4_XANCB|nr:hypothetical protein XCCB100_3115 [Xanthomonas campestris pv. campestris]